MKALKILPPTYLPYRVLNLANWKIMLLTNAAGIVLLFFWLFTRERPKIGFNLLYAYAAAPDWYFPRNHFVLSLFRLNKVY